MGRKKSDKPAESVRLPKSMWQDFDDLLLSYKGAVNATELVGACFVAYWNLSPAERIKCIAEGRSWDLRMLLVPETESEKDRGERMATAALLEARSPADGGSHEKTKRTPVTRKKSS